MQSSKFNTVNQLKYNLYLQDYLTSDQFTHPDREYLFLDRDEIKRQRIDGFAELFDFDRYKHCEFRKVQRRFDLDINNLN